MRPLTSLLIPPAVKKFADIKRVTDALVEKSSVKDVRKSILASLRDHHLPMAFQPIIHQDSQQAFGYEALARPVCGTTPIPPDAWFQITHDHGYSRQADIVAIRSAMVQSRIASRRHENQRLFVNVIASSLSSHSFQTDLLSLFEEGLCAPQQLVLEITEHVAYEPASLAQSIRQLRELGVLIALDDLGLGASNLSSIVELSPDFIKIDKSLIAGIATSPSKQRLVSQLVAYMGHGDYVIAEGIENIADLDTVKQIGVNLTQGYLWGKPQPFSQLPAEFVTPRSPSRSGQRKDMLATPSNSNGTVEIRNGRILVTDPKALGHFATIDVPTDPRLQITVNGKLTVGRTILQQSDEITVELLQSKPVSQITFKESADKMKVTAIRQIIPGTSNTLMDKDVSGHLVIEIEPHPVYPEPIESEDFSTLLLDSGYEGTIDYDAVDQLCHATSTITVCVLTGKPAVPGTPPSYTLLDLPCNDDPLRRRKTISTVTAGTKIAIAHPGLPGVPGRDIFGRDVPPPQPPPDTVLGNGVIQIRDVLVARREGRVLFTKSKIDVIPELVIGHDVTAKDGSIQFDGDILIYGSVLDGAQVQASGSVAIRGNVLCATVMAERGVNISGSIVGARVIGGQTKFFYQRLEPVLKRCVYEIGQLHQEYKTLYTHAERDGKIGSNIYMLASLLMEQRHPSLLRLLQHLASGFDDLLPQDSGFSQLVTELRTKWLVIGRTKIEEWDISQLHDQCVNLVDKIQRMMSASSADIRATSVTSSEVRATGRIMITGAGVFTSTLESDNAIVVKGNARGGFLIAQNAARVQELGTPSGAETSVQVINPQGAIIVNVSHPNTLLQVGDHRLRTYSTEQRMVYRGERHESKMRAR